MNEQSDCDSNVATEAAEDNGPNLPAMPKQRMSSAEIFAGIHREEQVCQTLPKRKGNLRVQIMQRSASKAELMQVYCYLRNKQFKFFKDNTMMELVGIIDFDLVQTVIVLVNDELQFDPERAFNASQNQPSAAMRP